MPMYEFACSKEHVSEELCAIGTQEIVCRKCVDECAGGMKTYIPRMAVRILSPTRTNFEFADSRRKAKP